MAKRINFIIGLAFLALVLAACSQAEPVRSDPTGPVSNPADNSAPLTADCQGNDTPDFSGYPGWKKVNPTPIRGHEVWINIYVNELADDIYLAASGRSFPVCAKIVKTHLQSKDSEIVTAVTVMVKMEAGYDSEHNDWWWGMYDGKGEVAEMSGKVQVCIDCHQPVAAEDFVFSKAVLSAVGK